MADDGDMKDDVRIPDGEIGDKIRKLFQEEEKDTSKPFPRPFSVNRAQETDKASRRHYPHCHG